MKSLTKKFIFLKKKFLEYKDVRSLAVLSDLQANVDYLVHELQDTKKELEKIQHENPQTERITFKYNCYFKGEDGPFCPHCWEKNGQLSELLIGSRRLSKNSNIFKCNICNEKISISRKR